jgi:exodeoxyribonuclease VII large subunit
MKKKAAPKDELGLAMEAPGDSPRTPITVSALTSAIRDVLEEGFGEVWVAGEISNFRSPGSGHLYFTLKDATATLSAVMFRQEAARVGFALRDGQAILARGAITVYEARGQYQLQVVEIQPRGQGTLQQRFEELKRRLQAEGLFETERKRELPVFPETIGIVTSLQGAVLQDMLRILQRRAPGIRILVRGVRVQGIGAEREIADAIMAFGREKAVDLLVVARGGGSLEDLWCFNEEVVARALTECPLPTISAVGHETDFTIADFVADLRAPTPSAAAELLTRDWAEWREVVGTLHRRMERHVRNALVQHRRHLAGLASSYALREPRRVVREWAQRMDDFRQQMDAAATRALLARRNQLRLLESQLQSHQPRRELARRRAHVEHLAARLRTLGPQATLDRGYALVLDRDGRPLRQADASQVGQPARIALSRGALDATIVQVHPTQGLAETLAANAVSPTAPMPPPSTSPKKSRPRRASGPRGSAGPDS